MKASKAKNVAAAREAKHRLENSLTEVQKAEKILQRKIPKGNERFSGQRMNNVRGLEIWRKDDAQRGWKG